MFSPFLDGCAIKFLRIDLALFRSAHYFQDPLNPYLMYYQPSFNECVECAAPLDKRVYNYSIDNFGAPLCRGHQDWIKTKKTTDTARSLYFALKQHGVPAELEKFDGYKTIDIAIPECKVNIEVDGKHHNSNPNQALSDLQRTYYSFLKGYITLRIPNSLVERDLESTVDYLVRLLNCNNQHSWRRRW